VIGMADAMSTSRREVASIAGDAALTAAALVFMAPINTIAALLAAWYLHGRRVDRLALRAGALGTVSGLVSVGVLYALLFGLGQLIGPIGGSAQASGIILFVLVAAVFLAAVVGLDLAAVKDLAGSRQNVRIDTVRLIATGVIVLGTVAVVLIQRANPGSEIADAGPFALMSAAVSAVQTYVAVILHDRWSAKHQTAENA
jgi:hypothetical protein